MAGGSLWQRYKISFGSCYRPTHLDTQPPPSMTVDQPQLKHTRRRSSSVNDAAGRRRSSLPYPDDEGIVHRSSSLPRPTTTNLLSPPEPPKLHSLSKHSPFGALLSRTLPNYTGKYDVGVCDIEIPVPRQTFGTFKHKNLPNSDVAGIALDTILFSLFYPCERQGKSKGVAWFPK